MNARPGPGTVVLGVHRSGTSVITGILHRLGGRVCRDDDLLHGTEQGHQVRYWESRSVVLFNEALLRALGGDWSSPPELTAGWWASPSLAEVGRAANDRFWSVHPARGWLCKDPRLCLTLPFWRMWVLPETRVVLVVRHPAEVAASLHRRDGISGRHAEWLWQRYMTSAVLVCRGLPALVIGYDQLRRDPVGTGAALSAWAFPDSMASPRQVRDAVAGVRRAVPSAPRAARQTADGLYERLNGLHGSRLEVPA